MRTSAPAQARESLHSADKTRAAALVGQQQSHDQQSSSFVDNREGSFGILQAFSQNQLTNQLLTASAGISAPAQLVLKVPGVRNLRRNGLTGEIVKAIHDYNHGSRSKSRPEKLTELNGLQGRLMTWFDNHHGTDLNASWSAKKMKEVLNEVQREHQAVVRLSVIHQDPDPPVVGLDQLSDQVQAKVNAVWNDLINDTGNIQISEDQDYVSTDDGSDQTVTHQGFKYETLAAFARILETEFGRELLFRANKDTGGERMIVIRPGNALGDEDIPEEEFAASPNSPEEAELTELDIPAMYGSKKRGSNSWKKLTRWLKNNFGTLTIPNNATENQRIQLIHNAPIRFASKLGYRVKIDNAWRYFQFGGGSGSTIVYTTDIKDSTDHQTSRFSDADGREIIAPAFLTLAHELGHALHFMEGNAVRNVSHSLSGAVTDDLDTYNWSELEEFNTIKGVENQVREGVGASERSYHRNFLSYNWGRLSNGPLNDALEAIANIDDDTERARLDGLARDVTALVNALQITEAEEELEGLMAEIQETVEALEAQAEEVQEDDVQEEDEAEENEGMGIGAIIRAVFRFPHFPFG